MPTDKSNADMLYAIIRQLDLKYIDWKAVAEECKISNGHAARMRFHRYKQTAENLQPSKRGPRGKTVKRDKLGDEIRKGGLTDDDDEEKYRVKKEVKDEPKAEASSDDDTPLARIQRIQKEAKKVRKAEPKAEPKAELKTEPKEEPMEDADDVSKFPEKEMVLDGEVAPPAMEGQNFFGQGLPWP
ncbi:hypothetical protein HDK77DRAFT_490875 [Phyllosticta capitalensis]